jgi:hypothetical protein
MPFVYTCPPPKTILNVSDSVYVYGNPKDVQSLEKVLNMPFLKQGNMTYLGKLPLPLPPLCPPDLPVLSCG